MRSIFTAAFAAALLICGQADAATYYVSTSGSDTANGTSEATAWKTLNKVTNATFAPGDAVRFKRGDTWTNQKLTIAESGTSTSTINFWHYGTGARPKITGGVSGECIRLTGSYLVIDNLWVDACGWAGLRNQGNNNTVKFSEMSHNAVAVQIESNNGVYNDNSLWDNNVMSVLTRGGSDDSGAFGFSIQGDGNDIHHNTVSGSNAFSYDFGRDGGAFEVWGGNNNSIHHNVSEDNVAFGELGKPSGDTASGNSFSYNQVRADCGANCAYSEGVVARGSGTSVGPTPSTTVQYNTIWLDGASTSAVVCHATCPSSTVIRGNIAVADQDALWIDGSGWTETANVFNGPVNVTPNGTSTTTSAGFVSAPTDLHLTGTSTAIDRAATSPFTTDLDGVTVPQNGNCSGGSYADSGAYEYDPVGC
jgi:hypothetical protein